MVLTRTAPDAAPMMEMNTTPLIDVMLVLLVMLIITIPQQTHAVKLYLPTGTPPTEELNPLKNKVVVSATGGLLFNGRAVDRLQLQALLTASGQLDPEPELQLQPEATAPYGPVDEVLAMTRRAQLTRLGFVGNESYARF
ncbi:MULTISPECIES: ExbD/TolR family protein [Sphingomonas]|uniref:ExbD/TolR family protein n=1 Tax=Sphingomonas TaxID=13687 RepID=UPI000DEF4FED|nr:MULTISPECIES: biopolymer transporter ExbD [Sphingomonas]